MYIISLQITILISYNESSGAFARLNKRHTRDKIVGCYQNKSEANTRWFHYAGKADSAADNEHIFYNMITHVVTKIDCLTALVALLYS